MKRPVTLAFGVLTLTLAALLFSACTAVAPDADEPTGGGSIPRFVGDAVEFRSGVTVTLESVEDTAPPGTDDDSSARDSAWLVFTVSNSTETALALPARPAKPTVILSDGSYTPVPVTATRVSLTNGGGGFGTAAGVRGEPYVNPGGSMTAIFRIEGASRYKQRNALAATYAPIDDESVTFLFP